MTQWLEALSQFHFLRPWWWLALLPVLGMVWLLKHSQAVQDAVTHLLSPALYRFLTQSESTQAQRRNAQWWPLPVILLLGIAGLAGPTVKQIPQPTFQVEVGTVLLLDMSLSMRATDVRPNRLTRARFKAMDFIAANKGGEMGVVAYAGDAFVISPITADGRNLATLIPALSPELMPVLGSDALRGLEVAAELLEQAGYQTGNIIWFTDGVDYAEMPELTKWLRASNYTVSVLAVGTAEGAPIQQLNGQLLKDPSGAIVIPKVNATQLKTLVEISNGHFSTTTADERDIVHLLDGLDNSASAVEQDDLVNSDKWYELGPYLLIPILLWIIWYSRPGYLFAIVACMLLPVWPQTAHAQNATGSNPTVPRLAPNLAQSAPTLPPPSVEQNLDVADPLAFLPKAFQNNAQRALQAYKAGDFDTAQSLFDDAQWLANTLYQQGDYAAALALFAQDETAQGWFNQGNALAATQQYEQALAAYNQAIDAQPGFTEAIESKEALELFLQQQPPSEQQNGESEDNDANSEQNQESSQSESNESQHSEQQDDTQSQQQEQSGQEQSQDNQSQASQENESDASEPARKPEEEEDAQSQTPSEPQNQDDNAQQDAEAQSVQPSGEPLTPEELEEQQRLQSLLNKVPDDPGYLLKRKMQLEYQQRQRQRLPRSTKKDW
ncbi:MAG: VWA domain-containing protein [Glaciecola sp.]